MNDEMIENEGKIDAEIEKAVPGNYWSRMIKENGGRNAC